MLFPVNDEVQTPASGQVHLSAEDIKVIAAARPYISKNLPKLLELVKAAKDDDFTEEQKEELETRRAKIQERVDVLVRTGQVIKEELRQQLIEADITLEPKDNDGQGQEHIDDTAAAQ